MAFCVNIIHIVSKMCILFPILLPYLRKHLSFQLRFAKSKHISERKKDQNVPGQICIYAGHSCGIDPQSADQVSPILEIFDWIEEQVMTNPKFIMPDMIKIHSKNIAAKIRMERIKKRLDENKYK